MSHPVEGENSDAKAVTPPETGVTSPDGAVSHDDVADVDVPDAEIPTPDLPEPEIPEPEIPEPAVAASVLDAPVIPPAPAADDDDPTPATRAERRALPSVDSLPEPAPIPRDPAVVPPASGATPGSYRGWTIAIFGILFLLLIAAVATIGVLLGTGASPFPTAETAPTAVASTLGWSAWA